MSDILIFEIIFLGIISFLGIIFLIIGISIKNNRKKKEIKCTEKTDGEIIDEVKRKSNVGFNYNSVPTYSWYPVIEYKIGETKIKKEYLYGNSKPKYEKGQKIQIYYNPQNPDEYYIAGDNIQTKVYKIFISVGIIALSVSILSATLLMCFF